MFGQCSESVRTVFGKCSDSVRTFLVAGAAAMLVAVSSPEFAAFRCKITALESLQN